MNTKISCLMVDQNLRVVFLHFMDDNLVVRRHHISDIPFVNHSSEKRKVYFIWLDRPQVRILGLCLCGQLFSREAGHKQRGYD